MTKDNTTYSLIVYFLILFTPVIAPQKNKIKFEHLSIEQGLSQNFVQDILQDQQGFLWFATEDGLNRYDGNEFKIYRHDTNNPKSISDNVILNLYEDDTGILWIGTRSGGVNIFDSANERFEHIRHNPDDTTSLSSDWVLAVHKDKSGILWIGTNGGGLNSSLLNSIKSKNGSKKRSSLTFIHYRYISSDSLSLSSDRVSSICEDSLGTLWFGTYGGGLNKFDRENGRFTLL